MMTQISCQHNIHLSTCNRCTEYFIAAFSNNIMHNLHIYKYTCMCQSLVILLYESETICNERNNSNVFQQVMYGLRLGAKWQTPKCWNGDRILADIYH